MPTLHRRSFQRHGVNELSLVCDLGPNDRLEDALEEVLAALRKEGAKDSVTRFAGFGSLAAHKRSLAFLEDRLGPLEWPLFWTVGQSCVGAEAAGFLVRAAAGAEVTTIRLADRPVGRSYRDSLAQVTDLASPFHTGSTGDQAQDTRETFEALVAALDQQGMNFDDVIRTWFYNDDILAWYGTFNKVRSGFFTEQGTFDKLVPASTGVGGANPTGAALNAGALALRPVSNGVAVREVVSPGQCSALSYGSSFSRAVEVKSPEATRVLVSGTASIDATGSTVFVGDTAAQIDQTLDVIEGLLAACGLGFEDTTEAIAYFRDAKDAALFEERRARVGGASFPVLVTENVICRDDLLFELELEASRRF